MWVSDKWQKMVGSSDLLYLIVDDEMVDLLVVRGMASETNIGTRM